jgi:transcriptional regulator with XRE-family HTH domain
MTYGKTIKKIRKKRGINQKQLAINAGIEQSYLSMVENGAQQPSRGFLEAVCYELDVPLFIISYASTTKNDVSEAVWDNMQKDKQALSDIFEKYGL